MSTAGRVDNLTGYLHETDQETLELHAQNVAPGRLAPGQEPVPGLEVPRQGGDHHVGPVRYQTVGRHAHRADAGLQLPDHILLSGFRVTPVVAFVRFGDGEIHERGYIMTPDAVVLMDASLLAHPEAAVLDGLDHASVLLANSNHSADELTSAVREVSASLTRLRRSPVSDPSIARFSTSALRPVLRIACATRPHNSTL